MTYIVINEPKTRKSFQKDMEAPSLVGMKIGDQFDGNLVGLGGFKLQLTGGSDKEGFPMRFDLPGEARRRILLSKGPGFNSTKKGMRKRKNISGNTVSATTKQINCKIIEGEGDIATILGIQPKEKKEEANK